MLESSKEFTVERIDYKKYIPIASKDLEGVFNSLKIISPNCIIIGEGSVGGKAENLIKYANEIQESGLHIKPFVVLTDECFERSRFLSGLSGRFLEITPFNQRTISKTDAQLDMFIKNIHKYFDQENILFVRSSSEGDAAGTGIRKSSYRKNEFEKIRDIVCSVISSDMTEAAEDFRRDAGYEKGISTIIMPIVGNSYNSIFAPSISGYAFTNQFQEGLHINIGPGIGGGISTKTNLSLDFNAIKNFESLDDYIRFQINIEEKKGTNYRGAEFKTFSSDNIGHNSLIKLSNQYTYEENRSSAFDLLHHAGTIDLKPLFRKLEILKAKVQNELYLEFALKSTDTENQRFINQIDTVETKTHTLEFIPKDKTLAYLNSVLNSGKRTVDTWYHYDYGSLDKLYEYNKNNENYGLIISDRMVSSIDPLDYSYYSNASIVLLKVRGNCSRRPFEHFGGAIKTSGKLFGVVLNSNPYIGYDMTRAPSFNEMRHNSNLEENIYESIDSKDSIKVSDGITIFQKKMIVENDVSRDYGVLYLP